MKLGEHLGPRNDPGDDSVVMRVHARWVGSTTTVMQEASGPSIGHVLRRHDGIWQLAFAVQRGLTRRQRHFVEVDPDNVRRDRWGLVKLAPGVWDVAESIVVPGQFHGFVTLLGVPDPAPWESGR